MDPADAGAGESRPLGTEMPEGASFVGFEGPITPAWIGPDRPAVTDLDACVACGLCLPHCPTYRLTGEESASPRGRIAAMRAVSEGRADVDETFASFMDLCLACRACEDVCPSHVPFGRMMERARTQIEPLRTRPARFARWLGLEVVLPHGWLLTAATALTPLARPFLPRRIRALVPRVAMSELGRPLPRRADPPAGVAVRGTVGLVAGCVQNRWFRHVNRATIRVLVRNGWRVLAPRKQTCCGALQAHNGRLRSARELARENIEAFSDVDRIVVNASGCGAHMKEYGELLEDNPRAAATAGRVRDLMEFLDEEGLASLPAHGAGVERVAYHDACHALRAQHVREQPRAVLRNIPDLRIVEIPEGDRCCGAAGLYNVLEPEMSGELMRGKAENVRSTGAQVVTSANPGCSMQLTAGLRELGTIVEVVHPVELLDRAYGAVASPRVK